jgi:hypothetical protein
VSEYSHIPEIFASEMRRIPLGFWSYYGTESHFCISLFALFPICQITQAKMDDKHGSKSSSYVPSPNPGMHKNTLQFIPHIQRHQ